MSQLKLRRTSLPSKLSKLSQLEDDLITSSNSHDKNIIYSLRSRIIFDTSECEIGAHASSEVENPPVKISTYIRDNSNQSKCLLRNSVLVTENKSQPQIGIDKLPNEMLTMIFSYLTVTEISLSVAPVCKRWYDISKSPVLWRRLRFLGEDISTEDARNLLSKSPLLREINISYRTDVEELLNQLCLTNRNVQAVLIKRCTNSKMANSWDWTLLHAKHINRLIRCCSRIKYLKLKEVSIRSAKFYHDLGIVLPNLTNLHLSHSHFLTPVHVMNIATKCTSLTRLWFSGEVCCGRSEDWESAYSTLFKQRWRTLTCVQFDASRLRDIVFKELSLCVNLKMLHLHKAVHLYNDGLTAIGTLPNLLSLRLHKANHLCSATLMTLFQGGNMKKLIYLSIAGSSCVTDDCADSIASYCPQLHVLSLAMIDGITDNGVETIIKQCSYLHYLDLFCMKNVTGSCLSLISSYAKRLNFLTIENICNVKKEQFVQLLLESDPKFKVDRVQIWKTGGSYKCKLL